MPPDDPAAAEGSKEALLAKATELFAEFGYEGASVRDIVNAVGVNVSLVSYYFGGKEGLYRACLERASVRRLELTQELLLPPTSVDDLRTKLAAYITASLDATAVDISGQRIIAVELDRGREAFDDLRQKVFFKMHELITTFFAVAAERGFMRADMHPPLVTSMLRGLIINESRLERLRVQWFGISLTNPEYRAICARHICELFLGGITSSAYSERRIQTSKE